MIRGSGLEKTNTLINLIKKQHSGNLIDKIYLYVKGLMNQNAGVKYLNDPKEFRIFKTNG